MDRTGLKNTIAWMILNYGPEAVLEEVLSELKGRNAEATKELRDNLEEILRISRSKNK